LSLPAYIWHYLLTSYFFFTSLLWHFISEYFVVRLIVLILITEFVTIATWGVPLVEQELLTLQEHLRSSLVFSGVRVAWSLVFCVMFCRSLFVVSPFSFGHCVVYPLIYSFWLPLCYLQTFFKQRPPVYCQYFNVIILLL
jgi:hypothetical protein